MEQTTTTVTAGGLADMDRSELEAFIRELILQREAETRDPLDVKLWPCQMTMDLMGLQREDLIDGLGEPAGAATALERMKRSAISLFI